MISVSIYSLSVILTIFCKYINFPADSHPWKNMKVLVARKLRILSAATNGAGEINFFPNNNEYLLTQSQIHNQHRR